MDLYRASGQKCSKLGKIGSWSLILNGVWLYNTSLYFILVWISDISCILHICTYACVRLHYITFFSSIWKIFNFIPNVLTTLFSLYFCSSLFHLNLIHFSNDKPSRLYSFRVWDYNPEESILSSRVESRARSILISLVSSRW